MTKAKLVSLVSTAAIFAVAMAKLYIGTKTGGMSDGGFLAN